MDHSGDNVLAGAAFAMNQHGNIRASHLAKP